MNRFPQTQRRHAGLTLVELMVALVLGVILIGGVLQLYVANKGTYLVQDDLSRLQESARFAMDMTTRDIRQAGYWGCYNLTPTNNLNVGGVNFNVGIQGTEGGGLNGSDSLILSGASGSGITIQLPYMPTPSASLHTNNNAFKQGDTVLVSDCKNGNVFQITNATPGNGTIDHNTGNAVSPGNAIQDLDKKYQGDAQIYTVQSITYTVATDGTTGLPNLYRKDGTNAAVPLLEGVEDMQILYGIDSDADKIPNRYVNAGAVVDWTTVVAVRIALLVRTVNQVAATATAQNYTLLDAAAYKPNDRYLRRLFVSTITLRNRTQ
jgi:type IV pilus assembly protein PilW